MNYTNLLYLVVFLFVYYLVLLFVPYATNMMQNLGTIGTFWSTIPQETHWLLNILLYIVVPLIAIAYTIISSKPEQYISVQG